MQQLAICRVIRPRKGTRRSCPAAANNPVEGRNMKRHQGVRWSCSTAIVARSSKISFIFDPLIVNHISLDKKNRGPASA